MTAGATADVLGLAAHRDSEQVAQRGNRAAGHLRLFRAAGDLPRFARRCGSERHRAIRLGIAAPVERNESSFTLLPVGPPPGSRTARRSTGHAAPRSGAARPGLRPDRARPTTAQSEAVEVPTRSPGSWCAATPSPRRAVLLDGGLPLAPPHRSRARLGGVRLSIDGAGAPGGVRLRRRSAAAAWGSANAVDPVPRPTRDGLQRRLQALRPRPSPADVVRGSGGRGRRARRRGRDRRGWYS
jgi:hypothetical protein